MISIESSWGMITTDDEGKVVELDLDVVGEDGERCYILDIAKFNIAEWDVWYEGKFNEPSPKPSEFDILQLGYWTKWGLYVEPNHEWRK